MVVAVAVAAVAPQIVPTCIADACRSRRWQRAQGHEQEHEHGSVTRGPGTNRGSLVRVKSKLSNVSLNNIPERQLYVPRIHIVNILTCPRRRPWG